MWDFRGKTIFSPSALPPPKKKIIYVNKGEKYLFIYLFIYFASREAYPCKTLQKIPVKKFDAKVVKYRKTVAEAL